MMIPDLQVLHRDGDGDYHVARVDQRRHRAREHRGRLVAEDAGADGEEQERRDGRNHDGAGGDADQDPCKSRPNSRVLSVPGFSAPSVAVVVTVGATRVGWTRVAVMAGSPFLWMSLRRRGPCSGCEAEGRVPRSTGRITRGPKGPQAENSQPL